jgi:hypothetical protein
MQGGGVIPPPPAPVQAVPGAVGVAVDVSNPPGVVGWVKRNPWPTTIIGILLAGYAGYEVYQNNFGEPAAPSDAAASAGRIHIENSHSISIAIGEGGGSATIQLPGE